MLQERKQSGEQLAATSFFTLLPVEIISKIFLEGTQTWRNLEPQSLPFPTTVAAVCTYWRMVAEDMPELWTFILPPLHKETEECLEWTSKWFERSGTKLVSVVLDVLVVTKEMRGEMVWQTVRKIAATLDFLADHSRRLRRLDVRSVSFDTFEGFMPDVWDIPNLEQLSLCPLRGYQTIYSFSEDDSRWSTLRDLPRLRKLKFRNISPPIVSTLTSLSTHNLCIDYEGIKDLFSTAPHLAHIVMHHLHPITPRVDLLHFIPVSAPSLRSIAVETLKSYYDTVKYYEERYNATHFSLFSYMAIPKLEYLEIQGDFRYDIVFGLSLSESLGTIKKLRIAKMEQLGNHAKILQSFYGLEELEIVHAPASELFPRAKVLNLSIDFSQVVWPQLRSIVLDTTNLNSLLSTVKFLEMRAGHPDFRIQNLELSRSSMRLLTEGDETSEDHAMFLRKFEKQGGKEWLSKFVDLRLLESPCYGLLDAERVPMAEML